MCKHNYVMSNVEKARFNVKNELAWTGCAFSKRISSAHIMPVS